MRFVSINYCTEGAIYSNLTVPASNQQQRVHEWHPKRNGGSRAVRWEEPVSDRGRSDHHRLAACLGWNPD